MRWSRPAPKPRKSVPNVGEHTVQSGPLRGLKLWVNDAQPAFREMIAGSYDDHIWKAMPETLAAGVVPDIGGHIGYHTLGMAAKYPTTKVVTFEPNPANLGRLRNVEMNRMDGRIEPAAGCLVRQQRLHGLQPLHQHRRPDQFWQLFGKRQSAVGCRGLCPCRIRALGDPGVPVG
ncbi:MAG: hypothetical protein IPH63_14405 [Flavobacteriales bacterium]|nr:hypothetical protein [Flavobacteriales bacterium]